MSSGNISFFTPKNQSGVMVFDKLDDIPDVRLRTVLEDNYPEIFSTELIILGRSTSFLVPDNYYVGHRDPTEKDPDVPLGAVWWNLSTNSVVELELNRWQPATIESNVRLLLDFDTHEIFGMIAYRADNWRTRLLLPPLLPPHTLAKFPKIEEKVSFTDFLKSLD